MRPLAFALAVAGAFAVGLATACVDVGWADGIRCDGESCPAGFMCCGGRCYSSCGGTTRPDASGAPDARDPVDAAPIGDGSAGTIGTAGAGGMAGSPGAGGLGGAFRRGFGGNWSTGGGLRGF